MDAEQLAQTAAAAIAAKLRAAVAERGRATVAFSGGSSAPPLFAALAQADVPWHAVDGFQVDERFAPEGDPERNLTSLRRYLLERVPLAPGAFYPMPVDDADPDAAAASYAEVLQRHAGRPPRIDVVHLGIGTDGHTASLFPGSPLLAEAARYVAPTATHHGRRRMTLTLPALSRARNVVWYASGAAKSAAVRRLVDGDASLPAGMVERSHALLLIDPPAAAALRDETP